MVRLALIAAFTILVVGAAFGQEVSGPNPPKWFCDYARSNKVKLPPGCARGKEEAIPMPQPAPQPQVVQDAPAGPPTVVKLTKKPPDVSVSVDEQRSPYDDILKAVAALVVTALGTLSALLLNHGKNAILIYLANMRSARLQEMVVNGINAKADQTNGGGKDQLNSMVKDYVTSHGAELLKSMGTKTDSVEFLESIKGRVERALNDPNVGTPASVTSPEAQAMKLTRPSEQASASAR